MSTSRFRPRRSCRRAPPDPARPAALSWSLARSLALSLAAVLALAPSAGRAEPARVDLRTPAGDAARILDPGGGRALRWPSPPRIALLIADPAERAIAEATLGEIGRLIGPAFAPDADAPRDAGDGLFDLVDGDPGTLTRGAVRLDLRRAGPADRRLRLTPASGPAIEADLFVVIAPGPAIGALGDALGPPDPRFWRLAARDQLPCFVTLARPAGSPALDYGIVALNPNAPGYALEPCLREELFQAMGLPNDAIGSPFFSFDNRAIPKDPRLDRLLLKALYAPEGRPGEPVLDVVRRFDALRRRFPRGLPEFNPPRAR